MAAPALWARSTSCWRHAVQSSKLLEYRIQTTCAVFAQQQRWKTETPAAATSPAKAPAPAKAGGETKKAAGGEKKADKKGAKIDAVAAAAAAAAKTKEVMAEDGSFHATKWGGWTRTCFCAPQLTTSANAAFSL